MSDYDFDNDDDLIDEDTQKNKFITFKIKNEEYALDIAFVNEIIGIQEVTHLPDMPDFITGIINLRGSIIPIIDLRKRFKMENITYSARACIIVIHLDDIKIGIVVDEVSEVLNIPENDIEPTPKTSKILSNRFIKAIGKYNNTVKIILDVEKILTDDEIEIINNI